MEVLESARLLPRVRTPPKFGTPSPIPSCASDVTIPSPFPLTPMEVDKCTDSVVENPKRKALSFEQTELLDSPIVDAGEMH